MFFKLKRLFWIYILQRKEIIGVDINYGSDYGCETHSYRDKKGTIYVEKIKYIKVKNGLESNQVIFDEMHDYPSPGRSR